MPSSEGPHRRMLDELIRSNAVDKRWAEDLIAGAATLEDLERAAIGTADNRWRIPRFKAARAWTRRGTWRGSKSVVGGGQPLNRRGSPSLATEAEVTSGCNTR